MTLKNVTCKIPQLTTGLREMPGIEPGRSGRHLAIALTMLIASLTLFGCPDPENPSVSDGGSAPPGGASSAGDNVPPTTPTGLTTTGVAPTQLDLNWNASADNDAVAGYRVFRNGAMLKTLGVVTTYRDTGLSASTAYSYTVQAFDRTGNVSGQSTAAIVTTPAIVDITAPSTPSGVTASTVSSSVIDVRWSPSADNVAVTGYRVFQNGTLMATLGNVTTYRDSGLLAGVTYIYTVRAFDAAGNISGVSNAATATTLAAPDTSAPTIPRGIVANPVSTSQINLSWSASTDNVAVAGYRVYRDGVFIALLANVTTFQDTGLAASTTYSYNLDAVDAAGNASALSATVSATSLAAPDTSAPSTPTDLNATVVSPSQINVSWSASTDNVAVAGYRVFRNGTLLATLANITTYQSTGLASSTTYSYAVRAFDATGNTSGLSTSVSATTWATPDTTAPTTPTGLGANTVSATQINLSWSPSTDNMAVTGYRVYRNGAFLIALGNVTSYQNTGLTPSTTYSYNVDAIDNAGNASGTSTAASATTLAPDTTAILEWDAVTAANLSGYRVYYGTAPGAYLQPKGSGEPVAANLTTYTVTGLGRGTRYYFAVTAYDSSNNESVYSNEVFKDVP